MSKPTLDPKALKRTLDALFTAESGGEPPAYVLIAVDADERGYADFNHVSMWSNVEEAMAIVRAVFDGMEPESSKAFYVPEFDA